MDAEDGREPQRHQAEALQSPSYVLNWETDWRILKLIILVISHRIKFSCKNRAALHSGAWWIKSYLKSNYVSFFSRSDVWLLLRTHLLLEIM